MHIYIYIYIERERERFIYLSMAGRPAARAIELEELGRPGSQGRFFELPAYAAKPRPGFTDLYIYIYIIRERERGRDVAYIYIYIYTRMT